jgi:thioredoxin 1
MTQGSGMTLDQVQDLAARSEIPVLIDCYTPTCGPCAALSPVLDELAHELADQIVIQKVDVAAHPQIAKEFGVRCVPTLLLFSGGQLKTSRTGAASKAQVLTWLSVQQAL